MENEPFLPPSERHRFLSSDIENESKTNATPGFLAAMKQVFSTKLVAVMIGFFMTGVGSSSVGALIGDIETFYGITDGPVSLIFPAITGGYLCGAWVLQRTLNRYGWRGVALGSPLSRLLSSTLLSAGLPFPFVIPAYLIQGLGLGLSDSGFCAWGTGVPCANVVQGMIHGSFATGAILGPIIAASVTRNGFDWYNFYRLLAILSCFELTVFGIAFRHDDATAYGDSLIGNSIIEAESTTQSSYLVAASCCGAFYFVYVGIENSFSGWSIEYMKRIRHLDPTTASFSSSIFWIGMTCGRFALGPVTQSVGLGKCVLYYIWLSLGMQFLIKYAPNAALSLAFLGINGFFLGPMFPSGMVLLAEKVSPNNKVRAVSAAAAMGQAGGAVAPLAIGVLADSIGIGHMLDIVLGLTMLLTLVWYFFRLLPHYDGKPYTEIRPLEHTE